MTEWKEFKLGEIADITPGFAFKSKDFGQAGELVVKIKDIAPPYIELANADHVDLSSYDKNKLCKYLLSAGDYVVAMTGATIGKVGKLKTDKNAYLNQRVAKIKAKEGVCDDFVYFSICGDDFQAFIQNNIDSNSAQENISANSIGRFPVSLPPLDEQRRIAAILSSLDDKIDLLHRENATLEQMAETLFRQWFVVEAKEEWEEGKLGDYVDVVDNRGKTPPYINNVTEYPIIEVNALTGNERYVNYDAVRKYVTKEVRDYWFRGHFQKNDILVSTVGSIGELAMCLEDKGVIAQNVIALHASKISPFYLYQYLLLNKDDLKGLDIGSVQPSIKVPHLLRMPIVLPPINLLNKYDSIMVEVIEKEKNNNKQIQTLIQTRDGLLPKLMSNEIAL